MLCSQGLVNVHLGYRHGLSSPDPDASDWSMLSAREMVLGCEDLRFDDEWVRNEDAVVKVFVEKMEQQLQAALRTGAEVVSLTIPAEVPDLPPYDRYRVMQQVRSTMQGRGFDQINVYSSYTIDITWWTAKQQLFDERYPTPPPPEPSRIDRWMHKARNYINRTFSRNPKYITVYTHFD